MSAPQRSLGSGDVADSADLEDARQLPWVSDAASLALGQRLLELLRPDEFEDTAEKLVLDDRGLGNALMLVEDPVGQHDSFVGNLDPAVRKIGHGHALVPEADRDVGRLKDEEYIFVLQGEAG